MLDPKAPKLLETLAIEGTKLSKLYNTLLNAYSAATAGLSKTAIGVTTATLTIIMAAR